MPKVDKGEGHNEDEARTKAAAWAWYEHAGGKTGKAGRSEAVVIRRVEASRPSRFKLEAEAQASRLPSKRHSFDSVYKRRTTSDANNDLDFLGVDERWDCGSSLFDSFELVRMSKVLDRGLTAPAVKPIRRSAVASSNRKPVAEKVTNQGHKLKQSGVHMAMPSPVCRSYERSSLHDPNNRLSGSFPRKATQDKSNDSQKNHEHRNRDSERTYPHQEKPRHRISFNGLSRALHYIAQLQKIHQGDLHEPKYHHHQQEQKDVHYHHHHHHHYLLPVDADCRLPDLNKSLILAATGRRVKKISPLPLHLDTLRKLKDHQ